MNQNYNLQNISKNRDVIYGFAILWIAFFHSTVPVGGGVVGAVKSFGDLGVDIFLLGSGISLYFAYIKNENPVAFYARRLKRVLIPTLLVTIPYFFLTDILLGGKYGLLPGQRIVKFLVELSGITLFLNGVRTTWFITAIILFYLIYPPVYGFFRKNGWRVSAVAGLIAFVLFANLGLRVLFPEFWYMTEIFWRRIPVFLVGAYAGKAVYEHRELPLKNWQILLLTVLLFGAVMAWGASVSDIVPVRYQYLFLAVFTAMTLSLTGISCALCGICRPFSAITLEIYLIHEKVLWLMNLVLEKFSPRLLQQYPLPLNAAAFAITWMLAVILHRITDFLVKKRN